MIITGIGTPSNHNKIPRPIAMSPDKIEQALVNSMITARFHAWLGKMQTESPVRERHGFLSVWTLAIMCNISRFE